MSLSTWTEAEAAAAAGPIPAIAVAGLHKAYGGTVALHDVTLRVEPGEVFGFLGPNGAGKTTTIKILVGLVAATRGQARIFGLPAGDPRARRRVGYLPELFRFHDWMTGDQLLDFHGRLAGLATQERRARAADVLELVGLTGRGGQRLRGYSKGMTQRIGLAQALIAGPDLVLLDEPTSALDPVGRREVRDVIRVLRDEGVTVFLNSHLLSEVERVCDRVAIVDQGRVVRSGPLADLLAGRPEVRVTLDRVDAAALALLQGYGEILDVEADTVVLGTDEGDAAPVIADAVVTAGYRLHALIPVHRTLEDVFVGLVEGGGQ